MIRMVVENGHAQGCRVGICGDLGSDPELTKVFVKMGVDELSVPPASILPLREVIRNSRAGAGKFVISSGQNEDLTVK